MDIKGIEKLVAHIRLTIIDDIKAFMNKHNTTEIKCNCSDTPVILSDLNDSCFSYTLDSVKLCDNEIVIYCSNCEDNDHFAIRGIDVETMLEVYKWLLDCESELFN